MRSISQFYTLYWVIYYPTCIAFNDLPGFSYIDEVMTIILLLYTFLQLITGNWSVNRKPIKEFMVCLGIILFYFVYSIFFGANVMGGILLDLMQEVRPYTLIFCTWILNPRFSKSQKYLMLFTMVATLFAWIFFHPETTDTKVEAEFPVLGQLAICTGMAWYLFTKETTTNKWIALGLVLTGMLAPKFKFMGEVVCFIALLFFVRKQMNFRNPRTAVFIVVLMAAVLTVTWQRFDAYYVQGWDKGMARPETYKTGLTILKDYFPLGPGMGTFACNGAWKYYSPLYPKYHLDEIWGLDEGGGFICDAYYPTLAQFGVVGVFFFLWFWVRRLKQMDSIRDLRYWRIAFMAFFCLAIEQTADSSWLSGKGMGYCMILGLCLNANRNMGLPDRLKYIKKKRVDLALAMQKRLHRR